MNLGAHNCVIPAFKGPSLINHRFSVFLFFVLFSLKLSHVHIERAITAYATSIKLSIVNIIYFGMEKNVEIAR